MANILLLEDDKMLSKGITTALEKDGHHVHQAYSFFEGVESFRDNDIDLFLLDINLPDGNGMAFCKKIREQTDTPIIFLTANDTENDIIEGFKAGCDDYLSKPFSAEILKQRVRAVLRRRVDNKKNITSYKELIINMDKRSVSFAGVEIKLTATEYNLLEVLFKNRGKVVSRSMLFKHIWDIDGNYIDENTLSVYIRRLRQKIEPDSKNPEYIVTVFGIGYTLGE